MKYSQEIDLREGKKMELKIEEFTDNQKLLELFKEYFLEFEIDDSDDGYVKLTPIFDQEYFNSYDVPLNKEGKIDDMVLINLAQRLSDDYDISTRINDVTSNYSYDREEQNEIIADLELIESRIEELKEKLNVNMDFYLRKIRDISDCKCLNDLLYLDGALDKLNDNSIESIKNDIIDNSEIGRVYLCYLGAHTNLSSKDMFNIDLVKKTIAEEFANTEGMCINNKVEKYALDSLRTQKEMLGFAGKAVKFGLKSKEMDAYLVDRFCDEAMEVIKDYKFKNVILETTNKIQTTRRR